MIAAFVRNKRHGAVVFALAMAICWTGVAADAATSSQDEQARRILDATGVKGGLIVHIGCADGKLTAGLLADDRYLVHGLDKDARKVDQARRYIRSLGLYGDVSVEVFDGRSLPYTDNLVNLVVAEDLGNVEMSEVMRVLAPGGAAYVKTGGKWTRTVKPRPRDIDEWTHYLHDASNNAVAQDTQVGPPRRLKWVCGPLWTRSHEFNSSLCAMVSANGRLFYIFDEGLTGVTTPSLPEKWTLIARDAFNGLLLWKRPMPRWGSSHWRNKALRSIPQTIPRRLVAQADRVFVTLGYDAAVSVLDAATGKTLTTYESTEGAQEIRCLDGVLILRKGANKLLAIDTKTGGKLWEHAGKIQPLSLAARDSRVFFQDGRQLLCLDVRNGGELWSVPAQSTASLLVVHDDVVLAPSRGQVQAFSVETGKSIWAVKAQTPRGELFVADQRFWHREGQRIVGRDLKTGEVSARIDLGDVFTPGHHPRCYQGKATEKFLITPNRGAEFVSLTGGEHTQNDWVRGACKYGVMPANGLLYVPPNPCFCYPGVKITGLNALAPESTSDSGKAGSNGQVRMRLEKGRAYGKIDNRESTIENANDWPTYRHDARRSGAATCEVAPTVRRRWQVHLGSPLTPPVVSGNRVYVAAKDEHTVYALGAGDGSKLWRFTADGRIDSPPTVYGGLVLFGCADGRVYCLRASDGKLAWRFTAASSDRRIIAFGRLESPWRVHGSILVRDGVAYCTAGRSSYLDGGIGIFALDPKTGRVINETRLDTWAPRRKDAEGKPFIPGYHIEGAQSDILVSQGDYIYLGQAKFDRRLARQEVPYVMPGPDDKTVAMDMSNQPFVAQDAEPNADYETHQRKWLENTQKQLLKELRAAHGGYSMGQRQMGLHVLATGGFLDDSWFNRTYWMYSATWPGFYLAHRASKTGQLLVVGPEKTYAVQTYTSRNLQSPLFDPGKKGYLLFADSNENEPVLDHRTRGTTKGWGYMRSEPPVWHKWAPVRIRSMVLAGKHLFIAGPPDVVDPGDPMAAFEGRTGGRLWALAKTDGTKLAESTLDAAPVSDGMIAAEGRLYLSLRNGTVLCMGGSK